MRREAVAHPRVRIPKPEISRETAWLLPVVAPVALVGGTGLAAAAWSLADSALSPEGAAGLLALLAASVFAEAFPVPIEGVPVGATSLANIFIVGAAVLYGWPAAVLVAFLAMVAVETVVRRPPIIRTLFNSGLYVAAALAAGGVVAVLGTDGPLARTIVAVLAGSSGFYATNVALLALVIARDGRESFSVLVARYIRWTTLPFAIMASVTVMLVVLWERSPALAVPLIGPLVAIALYQRSVHNALEAMRIARTDALTGLGNARHFQERLEEEFEAARMGTHPLTVCLLDVDDFKAINDVYGHSVGDSVLAGVAGGLRQDREAFRLGGDEFALLLPGHDEDDAVVIARSVVDRVARASYEAGAAVNLSAGVASFPGNAGKASELVRLADGALYRAKEEGKNRVATQATSAAEMGQLRQIADETNRAARLRAAASLAKAVDERDAYMERHSFAVGELAARLAARLGLDVATIELTRLAGRLHDIGKLAIPEDILRKHGPLTREERALLERHCQIGFRMLDSLGVEPVASWVLHHHERWDGTGYPSGLAGTEIPLGARIIFTADAFDAMTTNRVYQSAISQRQALEELERCAGTQFDPEIVATLRADLAEATTGDGETAPVPAG
ncbi:MAG: diguanylate cyclase [Actinomycetota bacterium]|nr:diguanylate cyclase [Actinomycetota bacterium]